MVFLIGATNRPDMVDPAMLRPGRFDQVIHVPLPDEATRRACFDAVLKRTPLTTSARQLVDKLPALTDGFSGADIAHICSTAGKLAIRSSLADKHGGASLSQVDAEHVSQALAAARRSVSDEERLFYEQIGVTLLGKGSSASQDDVKHAGPMSEDIANFLEARTAEWKRDTEAKLSRANEKVKMLEDQMRAAKNAFLSSALLDGGRPRSASFAGTLIHA
eukprot:m.311976 g.311976  ORF g.311976 m.311976 type:complete len:219 (-) comp19656_c0_seq2:217-873(-)